MPLELDDGRPQHVARDVLEQLLDPRHRVLIVGVRLVPLEHRELGLVLVRDAFVTEVLADLVDPLQAADDEPLEIELGRDAQVEIGGELVRVRDERVREGAAVARLKHGRLDLDEAGVVQVLPDRRDDPRPRREVGPRLLAHQQVEVALPVAELGILEAVEGVGQRAADLREQHELVDGERGLTPPRLHRLPRGSEDVAEVDVHLARALGRAEQLNAARAVDEVEEDELAHVAPRHHAAGDPHRPVGVLAGLERLGGRPHGGDLVPVVEALGEVAAHGGEPTACSSRRWRRSCT